MREPQVTRTITTTVAAVLCVNVLDGTTINKNVELPRTYKDETAMLKAAKKLIETDELKAVHIIEYDIIDELYGMSETEFISLAKKLPPRGTKQKAIADVTES